MRSARTWADDEDSELFVRVRTAVPFDANEIAEQVRAWDETDHVLSVLHHTDEHVLRFWWLHGVATACNMIDNLVGDVFGELLDPNEANPWRSEIER